MKEKRKIWLIAVICVMAEVFAFPEILFPDCIRVKEVQQEEKHADESQTWMKASEQQPEFEWRIWLFSNIKKAG